MLKLRFNFSIMVHLRLPQYVLQTIELFGLSRAEYTYVFFQLLIVFYSFSRTNLFESGEGIIVAELVQSNQPIDVENFTSGYNCTVSGENDFI